MSDTGKTVVSVEFSKKAEKGIKGLTEDEKIILETLEQHVLETAGKHYDRGWKSLCALPQLGK